MLSRALLALPVQWYGSGAGASHLAPAKAVQGVSHCLNATTICMQGCWCIPKGLSPEKHVAGFKDVHWATS